MSLTGSTTTSRVQSTAPSLGRPGHRRSPVALLRIRRRSSAMRRHALRRAERSTSRQPIVDGEQDQRHERERRPRHPPSTSRSAGVSAYARSGTSVISMCPGAWVIANGTARPSPRPAASPRTPRTSGRRPSATSPDRRTRALPSEPTSSDPGSPTCTGAPCTAGIRADSVDRRGHQVGRDGPHRHHQRPVQPARRPALPAGHVHRHVAALLDVPQRDPVRGQGGLEGERAADVERDQVVAPVRRARRSARRPARRPARPGSAAGRCAGPRPGRARCRVDRRR